MFLLKTRRTPLVQAFEPVMKTSVGSTLKKFDATTCTSRDCAFANSLPASAATTKVPMVLG